MQSSQPRPNVPQSRGKPPQRWLPLLGMFAAIAVYCGYGQEPPQLSSVPSTANRRQAVTFSPACDDVGMTKEAKLIAAINAANDEITNPGQDVIELASGCVYTFTAVNNYWYGPNALPPITSDIVIQGVMGSTGVTLQRSVSAPEFRFFFVNGAPTSTNNVLMGNGKLTLRRLTLTGGRVSGGTSFGGGGGGMGAGAVIFAQGPVMLDQVLVSINRANGGGCGPSTFFRCGGGGMFGNAGLSSSVGGGGSGGGMAGDGANSTGGNNGYAGGPGPVGMAGGKPGINGGAVGAGGTAPGPESGADAGAMAAGGAGGPVTGARGFGTAGVALGAAAVGGAAGDGGGGGSVATATDTSGGGGGGAGFGGNGGAGTAGSGATALARGGGGGGFGGGGGGGAAHSSADEPAGGGGGGVGGGGAYLGGGGFGGGGGGRANGGFGGGAGFGAGTTSIFGGGPGLAGGGGCGAALGGAVFTMYSSLTVANSTLESNTAGGGSGTSGGDGLGGAIFSLNSDVTVINSSLSRNGAVKGSGGTTSIGDGSSIYVLTLGMNAAGTGAPASSVVLQNSILANPLGGGVDLVLDQRAGTLSIDASAPNLVSTRRISGTVTANLTGISTANAKIDLTLTSTGGPTKTLALLSGSPAIDTGDNSICAAAPISGHDQRDFTRPVGTRCDIGAVEFGAGSGKANGQSCTMGSECNSTFCTDGVCCDTACAGGTADCVSCLGAQTGGTNGTCGRITAAAAYACRPQASGRLCDKAEVCTGASDACPADENESAGTVCRPAAPTSACDVPESCTGSSADCPADGFVAAGTVCRPAAATNLCDAAETCTGTGPACPTDQVKPMGTICRPVRGPCDVAELCNGSTKDCPIDVLRSSTEICKPAGANPTCDPPDYCDAIRTSCPARFAAYGSQGTSCVAPMQCNGTGRCVN